MKTTSPENYRVRPSSGLVSPEASVEVNIHLQPGTRMPCSYYNGSPGLSQISLTSTLYPQCKNTTPGVEANLGRVPTARVEDKRISSLSSILLEIESCRQLCKFFAYLFARILVGIGQAACLKAPEKCSAPADNILYLKAARET